MITNPKRRKQIEEFIDKDHAVMNTFYEITDQSLGRAKLKKAMQQLVKDDPDFYDPYSILADILYSEGKGAEAEKLITEAYERALQHIVDSQGRWPKAMEWGWLENRHVMRAIERYAYLCWESSKTDEALDIFRKLLRANPGDNQGTRHSILAIRMGLGVEWDKPFVVHDGPLAGEALDALKVSEWFEDNAKHYPDEFDWLFKEWKKRGY